MKKIITIFLVAAGLGCSKQPGCRLVTITIVNGCSSPVSFTYPVKDEEYCGEDLVRVRKLNGTYQEYPRGSGVCRITTLVSEK